MRAPTKPLLLDREKALVSDHTTSTQSFIFKVGHHHKTTLHMDTHILINNVYIGFYVMIYSTLKM